MPDQKTYRVVISGGGTGGHIYPAIAIAGALKEMLPSVEILFVGALGRMEMEKVPKAGYEIIGLPIAGIQRRLTWKNLLFPFKLFKSMNKARAIIKDFKPDVAIGVGGYASGPLLRAAASMGVPTLLQEQNSYAGLTNKWLAKKATTICVAYDQMEKYFPKEKIVFTGNPVRKDILEIDNKREEALKHFGLNAQKPIVLVIGGSLGALTINESIGADLAKFEEQGVQVIWQTGKSFKSKAQELTAPYSAEGIKAYEFIYEMDLAYAAADLVVSRAGALSISELCLVRKPVVLVPSPNVAEDHQTKNANALVSKNAAIIVRDDEARDVLVEKVLYLLLDSENCQEMVDNIKGMAKPEAAKSIAEEVSKILE